MRKLVNYTPEKFSELVIKYHKGEISGVRWGQILHDEFVEGDFWSDLYNEMDDQKANEMFSVFVKEHVECT